MRVLLFVIVPKWNMDCTSLHYNPRLRPIIDRSDHFSQFGYGSPTGANGRRPSFVAEAERGRGEDRAEGSSSGWMGQRDVSMRRSSVEREDDAPRTSPPTSGTLFGETSLRMILMYWPGLRDSDRVASPMADQRTTSPERQQQVVQRSRWQAIVSEAGGISAAVSEESMRRLKYCLQWLQVYALLPSISSSLTFNDSMQQITSTARSC